MVNINNSHNSIILLQVRMSSTRLPAKALLPIKEFPTFVLAAKRAVNTGRRLLITTTNEPSDDCLVTKAQSFGFQCFRGSGSNVLGRFVDALDSYDGETLVFRLTADNVFPDGALLDEMEDDFLERNLNYLICHTEGSGVPDGVSVELMRLKELRCAAKNTINPYDIEHVTPFLKRKFGTTFFDRYKKLSMGHFRCTIDNFDDYLNVVNVFKCIEDPVNISFLDLINKLHGQKYQPQALKPAKFIVLGGAQIGSAYGISNTKGVMSESEARDIIKVAIGCGISWIDTARAYGNSEYIVGNVLSEGWASRVRVITKLAPMDHLDSNATPAHIAAEVRASLGFSMGALRQGKLDTILLHRGSELSKWRGALWSELLRLRDCGLIKSLGVSIQNELELLAALDNADVEYIQMPYNILDYRWKKSINKIVEIKKIRPLTIHARSVFLQGLLLHNNPKLWRKTGFEESESIFKWMDSCLELASLESAQELCIAYLKSMKWIDGIVIGVDSLNHLIENISCLSIDKLPDNVVEFIDETRPKVAESFLDPSQWGLDKACQ